jgi:threonine dehydrogenase-like Zn-dependent dehydrogenase
MGDGVMKALVYVAPQQMEMQELEVPQVGPDDVLIEVAYSGICGSELSGYLGTNSLRHSSLGTNCPDTSRRWILASAPCVNWLLGHQSLSTLFWRVAGASSV